MDGTLVVWGVPDGRKLATYRASCRTLFSLVSTPLAAKGDLSIVAHDSGAGIRLLELASGKETFLTNTPGEDVSALAMSPDGGILASAMGLTGRISLWDVARGQEFGQLDAHGSWVSALVFDPNGGWPASSSGDETICLWNLRDLPRIPPPRVLRGHKREVWQLAALPDGKTLVSGGEDGEVCVWTTQENQIGRGEEAIPATNLFLAQGAKFAGWSYCRR